MFHLHYDTDLERLADGLAALLTQPDLEHLLQPQTVLVPQAGLQRWLVQRLAEQHGIAANLEFLAPAQLAWRLLRASDPNLPTQSGFDRDILRWRILALLEEQAGDDPNLAALIASEPVALRRFDLAAHFAQLFERYQAYRRDMLETWAGGAEADDTQARLWRALLERANEKPRSSLLAAFLRRHVDGNAPPAGLPPRIFAFGCSNVSPDVLRLLGVAGRHCELHFFLPSPCREYWGDVPDRRELRSRLREEGGNAFDEPANPLLVSLGGVGRDFIAQLYAYDEVQPDFESEPHTIAPPRRTLLQRVQADVITLDAATDPDDRLEAAQVADGSLQVHSCHSPLREVQVLHDRLLDLFARMPELQPRDIAVMLPNVQRYAPCVDAVFGAVAADDPRYIPWTIADRPIVEASAIAGLFERLLDLPASRLGIDDVLQVLAVPAVLRACGLQADDLQRLREWTATAGICWGEDERDREALGLPPYREFSWRFGRERLLLGYMLGDEKDDTGTLYEGIAPLADIEGQRASALGALLRVQRVLRQLRAQQQVPKSPFEWQRLLNRALDRLLGEELPSRVEVHTLAAVRRALGALAEDAAAGGYARALDWMSVRAFLHERLLASGNAQRFLAGGISVCGMLPLRNVPFRVICMLGMDAEAFPRRDPADALSRLHAEVLAGRRRPGDRSLREDDRYLFLQTLMAARDVLYLSYTGVDMRDAKPREPSVVLDELLHVVSMQYCRNAVSALEALVTRHPMQPFARSLFDGRDSRQFSYRLEWQAAAATDRTRGAVSPFVDVVWPQEPAPRVSMDELQRFFAAPQREFLRRQLGIALESDTREMPEREPLLADFRLRANLDRQLVGLLLQDSGPSNPTGHLTQLRAQGLLPPLALGESVYVESEDVVAPQALAWRRWRAGEPVPAATRFELALPSGRVLDGVLPGIEGGGYAGWVGRANSATRWFHWWLDALVARALCGEIGCIAFGRDEAPLRLPLLPAVPDASAARAMLDNLLELRVQGLATPLPMPPRSAWVYAKVHNLKGDPDAALEAAATIWNDSDAHAGECRDIWIATALRGASPFEQDAQRARFTDLTQQVYAPLWTALGNGSVA